MTEKVPVRVAMILTSNDALGASGMKTGFWFEELASPYYAFVDAGFDVVLASPRGGHAPIDPASTTDDMSTKAVHRFRADATAMRKLEKTQRIDALDVTGLDAVFLVGGHGVMWDFPTNAALGRLLRENAQREGIVAAVCHGVAGLLATADDSLVRGRALTGFSNAEEAAVGATSVVPFLLEDELTRRGAIYTCDAPFTSHVVHDGNVITGQNPGSSHDCGALVATVLAQRAARKVAP